MPTMLWVKFFIMQFAIGFVVGFSGAMNNWSKNRVVLTSFVASLISSLLILGLSSEASDKGLAALRASTYHLDVGTGFLAKGKSGKTYIVTNWHVCMHSRYKNQLFAVNQSGSQVVGEFTKWDADKDLCAAEVKNSHLPTLLPAKSLSMGQPICTRGYPGHILTESCGKSKEIIEWVYDFDLGDVASCDKGFIPVLDPVLGRPVACRKKIISILTTLYGRPGSSGSPVVDDDGALVGVVSDWHPMEDHDAGMRPFFQVKEFLDSL